MGLEMFDLDSMKAYCLSKPGVYEDRPFGDIPICYKVRGRIFAQIYPHMITVKCTPFSSDAFRQAYPGVVVRGYHCPPVQQPHWNTIYLDRFPAEELPRMIDHAYETVIAKFSRKVQLEIMEGAEV